MAIWHDSHQPFYEPAYPDSHQWSAPVFMPPEATKRPFEREDACVIISILLHRTQTMNNEQLKAVSKCKPRCLTVIAAVKRALVYC